MSILLANFKSLTARRLRLLGDIRQAGPEAASFHPMPGAWSMLQVAEHLYLVERAMLAQARRNTANARARAAVGGFSRIRLGILVWIMRRPMRVKAPTRIVIPEGDPNLDGLEEAWTRLSGEMGEFIESLSPDLGQVPAVKHPIFGWFSSEQALQFLVEHFDHHKFQIQRIKESPGFPGKVA